MVKDKIYELEKAMWEAAKSRNSEKYLEIVSEEAVMICGGFRCSGREYAAIIGEFDCKSYTIECFEIVCEDENIVQTSYIVTVEVSDERNADLAGKFRVTTTWKRMDDGWKAVFNMDRQIE